MLTSLLFVKKMGVEDENNLSINNKCVVINCYCDYMK